MPTATRQTPAPRAVTSTERRNPKPAARAAAPSGWYDPDGAAWEAESTPDFEAFRATPVRPMRPAIRVEGDPRDD
jgi:hypothetical protein